MKSFVISILLIVVVFLPEMTAQQLPMFNNYRHHGYIVNPAMSGAQMQESVALMFRYQWRNVPGSPITGFATYDTHRLRDDFNTGLSAYLMYDQTGPSRVNGFSAAYSYHLEIPSYGDMSHFVSGGISVGLFQYRIDGDELIPHDTGDPLLVLGDRSSFLPDVSAGIYYYNDYVGFGFSVPQLLGLKAQFQGQGGTSIRSQERHYYGMVHARIPTDSYEDLVLVPSLWFKYVPHSPYHINFNLRADFNKLISAGIGYSTANQLTGELGVTIDERYIIGYAFGTQISDWNTLLGDTHEIHFKFIIDSEDFRWY